MALIKVKERGRETVNLGRRNILYNGAMQVAQRGTSFSGGTSNALYTVDRFATAVGSSFNLDTTITQSTTVPSGEGFKYSLKVEADAVVSTSSGQNGGITQRIEAQDVDRLVYGTSGAKTLTLSFWVRSNKTGIYCAQLQTNIGNSDAAHRYSHVKEYTISSANTWEKKTLTFPGHTGQVINSSPNNDGLRINWWLTSDAADNQSADTWSQTPAYGSTSNQVDFMDSASNEWYLTGCQLEVGDTATEFEHRSFGEELALCQRYYQTFQNGQLVGTRNTSTRVRIHAATTVHMRGNPTVGRPSGTEVAFQKDGSSLTSTNTSPAQSATSTSHYIVMDLAGFTGAVDRTYGGASNHAGITVLTAEAEL